MSAAHTRDSDCDGHIDDTGACAICGAWHGDECQDCGGRAYHDPACLAAHDQEDAEAVFAPDCTLRDVAVALFEELREMLARSEVPEDATPFRTLCGARYLLSTRFTDGQGGA